MTGGQDKAALMASALGTALQPGGPHGTPTVEWVDPRTFQVAYSGGTEPAVTLRVQVEVVE
jgi:hypothetical protein